MLADSVQYAYAIQDDNRSVSIHSLTRETSGEHKYYCPNCRGEMYPTFGEIQYHHFRHNGTQCQHDNYLHSLAEHMFLEEYVWCLENKSPFILEIHNSVHCDRNCVEKKNRLCTKHSNINCIDLTQIYTKAQLETNVHLDGGRYRRPDILLTSENGEQLWIEIWVKHETKEDKRQDGNILELKISSEKDLEQIVIQGLQYEATEKEKAAERKALTRKNGLKPEEAKFSDGTVGQTRDIVAKKLGISGKHWERMKYVDYHKADLTEEEYNNWKIGKISTSKLYTQLSKSLKYTEVLDSVIEAIYDMEETIRKYNISYADTNIKHILDSALYSYKGHEQEKKDIYAGVGKILKEKYAFTDEQKWELVQIRMKLQKLRENIKDRK